MRTRYCVVTDSESRLGFDQIACKQECDGCSIRFICLTTRARDVLPVTMKDNPDIMSWTYVGREKSCELVNDCYKPYCEAHHPYRPIQTGVLR